MFLLFNLTFLASHPQGEVWLGDSKVLGLKSVLYAGLSNMKSQFYLALCFGWKGMNTNTLLLGCQNSFSVLSGCGIKTTHIDKPTYG